MDTFTITGGASLRGNIPISGCKNAVLPIIAATLLLNQKTILHNVPKLRDVHTLLQLLRSMGAAVEDKISSNNSLIFSANRLTKQIASYELVKTMRASVVVLGPLLARYGQAVVSLPGGCAIGSRPVDLHLKALAQLGAEIYIENGYIYAKAARLKGADIIFDKITVTGTENLLMAAVLAKGKTYLRNAAKEPEVCDLAHFLNKMGAKIQGIGSDTLEITGVDSLSGGTYCVLADRVEALTYLIAAMMTKGHVRLDGISHELLTLPLQKLQEAGAKINYGTDWIRVDMQGRVLKAVDISTEPYPGMATDMQAQFMAMNTVAQGSSVIAENIFENRFMHVDELRRMGADIQLDGHVAICRGKSALIGAQVMATDLRASAALVLAGLVSKGQTTINRIYHLDRGYDALEHKLSCLGAKIRRVRNS